MTWAILLKTVLGIAAALARYVERRQLLEAGKAMAIARSMEINRGRITRALAARRTLIHDPDSLRNDPDRTP